MARSHFVQVRLDDEEEAELERLAQGLEMSKSEMLRQGMEGMREGERLKERRAKMHLLIDRRRPA